MAVATYTNIIQHHKQVLKRVENAATKRVAYYKKQSIKSRASYKLEWQRNNRAQQQTAREKEIANKREEALLLQSTELEQQNTILLNTVQLLEQQNKDLQTTNTNLQNIANSATKQAELQQLQNLLTKHKPTTLTYSTNNKIQVELVATITAKKAVAGDRQLRRRRTVLNKMLGEGNTRKANLSALVEGKLGEEVQAQFPKDEGTTPATVLALHAEHDLSFHQLKACKRAGWKTATLKAVEKLSAQHKIPVVSCTETVQCEDGSFKTVRYGGYTVEHARTRIEKALQEMIQTKQMVSLTNFAPNVIPVGWYIDKGGGMTKLGFHFGAHKKPGRVSNLLYMYEDSEELSKMIKYFGHLLPLLESCESVPFVIDGISYLLMGFVGGDLKFLSEAFGHSGAKSSSPCLKDFSTQVDIASIWVPGIIHTRTLDDFKHDAKLVQDYINNPHKKQLISCANCGEFGHSKATCTIEKATAVCDTCQQVGHCRNSNNINKSGNNTNKYNSDCRAWSGNNFSIWKTQAQNQTGYAELDTQKTHSIKSPNRLFSWIPPTRIIPPFLHCVTLGICQKGVDMVKKCCEKYELLASLHAFWTSISVQETVYHGGQFEGNHIRKIVKNYKDMLALIEGKAEYSALCHFFGFLSTIQELSSCIL